jgi:hypothetical protein
MEVVDLPGALEIIDEAITTIDAFDAIYHKAADDEGPAFQRYWDESLEVEQTAVLPRLELARQIAAHIGADDLPITGAPGQDDVQLPSVRGESDGIGGPSDLSGA